MKNTNLITTTGQAVKTLIPIEQMRILTSSILYCILGLFISKGTVFGMCLPFGTAFLSAVPYNDMMATMVGTVIGYILPSEVNIGVRYISTAIAICAIRWTLSDLPKVREHKLYAPIVAAATTIATGLAINISNISDVGEIAMYITEAILSGGMAYFFHETINIFSVKKTTIKQSELAYICMTVFVVILSLASVYIGSISIGRVISVLFILFCARYLGVTGGSISGVTAGVILGLATMNPSYIMGAYSFAGLISGLMSSFGKTACWISFLVSTIIISMQTANPTIIISGVYEVLIAGIIFIFLPDDIGNKFIGIFCSPIDYSRQKGLKEAVVMRLDFTARALLSISDSINVVAEKLSNMKKETMEDIYTEAQNKVCENCGLRIFCFNTKKEETTNSFEQVTQILKEKGEINFESFPAEFTRRCYRTNELADNINQQYKELTEKEISGKRVAEVRNFVSGQFSDIGVLLSDIATEFKDYDVFDLDLSCKVSSTLKCMGIIPIDVSCRRDKFGRIYMEIEVLCKEKEDIEKLALSKELSKLCARSLDMPCITEASDRCRIQIAEKPIFDVQVGVTQHIYKNGILCGDNYKYFNDGMGRMIFILSDGMGTGGRAAVEGAMACQVMETLIKSGISFKTAVRITNSALLIKSEDEFLATLDVFCIDLFNGNVDIIKAGAPLTLIRKNGEIIKTDKPSLPIGILQDINISTDSDVLSKDDRVLMLSDGAISQGDEWLEDEIKNWQDEDAQSFSEHIVSTALKNKDEKFDDDITVLAMKMVDY